METVCVHCEVGAEVLYLLCASISLQSIPSLSKISALLYNYLHIHTNLLRRASVRNLGTIK